MGVTDEKLAKDAAAWFGNVTTSVLIVFVNKVLMDPRIGYKFVFATTLCAFHFLACGGSVRVMELVGVGTRASMPWTDCLTFAVVASVSIASLNLSLLVNSVGFYQISKLLIIPFVCLVEYLWYKRKFTFSTVMSILVVVSGVAVVTVTDVAVNPLGLAIAIISVVTSGLQQIMCGAVQRRLGLTSNQLLSNTAPVQGVMLLVVGPFVDQMITGRWVLEYDFNVPAVNCLLWSCGVAVLVNISQFMCLGRFSAVTFQVLGHTKTVLVLLCGWLYLGDVITNRKLGGMVLAVVGMASYGYFNAIAPPSRALSAGSGGNGPAGGLSAAAALATAAAKRSTDGPALGPLGSAGSGDHGGGGSDGEQVSVAVHSSSIVPPGAAAYRYHAAGATAGGTPQAGGTPNRDRGGVGAGGQGEGQR